MPQSTFQTSHFLQVNGPLSPGDKIVDAFRADSTEYMEINLHQCTVNKCCTSQYKELTPFHPEKYGQSINCSGGQCRSNISKPVATKNRYPVIFCFNYIWLLLFCIVTSALRVGNDSAPSKNQTLCLKRMCQNPLL